ncbi:MAG: GNAT family N-acetyltransferase [Rikenellaceae bacterium]
MDVNRIRSIRDPYFAEAWRIYNDNFPFVERRTIKHQEVAFEDEKCHFELFTEGDKPIGMTCYWLFDEYLYVEHLAIDKTNQGGGYGTKLLDFFLKTSPGLVILEIEPVIDDLTTRRLHFYERFGFQKNDHYHVLVPYHDSTPNDMEMVLMTYPKTINKALFDKFVKDLREIVMRK